MNAFTNDDRATLEDMVDRFDLQRVLGALVEICHEKTDHVQSNWQDKELARLWIRNAKLIETVAAKADAIP